MGRRQELADVVKVRTLPVQVAAHLTRRIVNGELEDERAPSELDISQEFGVSRAQGERPADAIGFRRRGFRGGQMGFRGRSCRCVRWGWST